MKPLRGRRPIILITQGDCNGVGPEIAIRAALSPIVREVCAPVLTGSIDVFEYYARMLQKKVLFREIEKPNKSKGKKGVSPSTIPVVHINKFERVRVNPGKLSAEAGKFAGDVLAASARLCLQGLADALVTAPVSKEAMNLGGYKYPGQTEMLADLSRTKDFAMLLVANNFRVGLATIHLPLRAVHRLINRQRIFEKLKVIHRSLKRDFAIRAPKIAVLGLNPHAGEHGLLGTEETGQILPAIAKARAARIHVDGPFPADGFFATRSYKGYDTVLAMYHDQGLIPLKMMGFEVGVNFTAGLPLVRTSPGHGTAFNIAGKNIANPRSMIEAVKLAASIVRNRMKGNLQ